jgi:hypothetical protein
MWVLVVLVVPLVATVAVLARAVLLTLFQYRVEHLGDWQITLVLLVLLVVVVAITMRPVRTLVVLPCCA